MAVNLQDYTYVYCGGFPFPGIDEENDVTGIRKQSLFSYYQKKATAKLNRYKRIYTVKVPEHPNEDKLNPEDRVIYAMIEAYMRHDAAKEAAVNQVASASIGSVSVNYGGVSDKDAYSAKELEKELYRCASLYLDIYRGVG